MSAYAIAQLRAVDLNEEVIRYVQEIDATLEPFGGRFLVHGTDHETGDGEWPGHVVVIEFPDLERGRAWYESEAYQRILPLRTENSDGAAILVDGVEPGYRAASFAEEVLAG